MYKLCEKASILTFDYSEVYDYDKSEVVDWLKEIYYNYENELCNASTFYVMCLDVEDVMRRMGYKCEYKLCDDVLRVKIVRA